MKISELKRMSEVELNKLIASLREQLRTMRFKIYSKEVKNNHQLRVLRKDIARILTILNQQ
ncbi:MAG: 50S ribosomal protein L29 [Candidatus Doudnabacteria bacterium RIFCSPLOWO2_02_FULL_48_8]|uniref:Large ribosomal subunit protein uL29 n=1 Tax=Candidatus Doudnabacteria bacterium RIFCSPHIGHO2_01_FULL_46_24 TaxID=1817825 RepID=A0A1F5NUX9_9BACT|nr:MAG: 50S ribosomal protein L29 [Candidatus Doudnabacteria bacterium RIFCSPHIGHO2_01_FULL_46_24]OGE95061.1 MAG: 50S ribosomal protein L29 [Candidatus Doudnabacteria bacterium RIFCSPLOWO2_02_FULL_48_8]OGE95913.1 MAG: 50S ribosomal protein L29 [Candidatus Doudnabacteria bacterium RIFCSPHIGHO2_12_FULL_48_11]